MEIRAYKVGPYGVNTYLIWDNVTLKAAVVDPTLGSERIVDDITQMGLNVDYILNTHGHCDHIARNAFFKRWAFAAVLLHDGDLDQLEDFVPKMALLGTPAEKPPSPDRLIVDGETIQIGSETLTVLHTPGHSPGSVCFLGNGFALTGDTLLRGMIGRTEIHSSSRFSKTIDGTHMPGASREQLIDSIRHRLLVLHDEIEVYAGHGPSSTIGRERQHNSALR